MTNLIARLEAAKAKATPGPYDVGPCNIVRAIRGELAIPLFEPRFAFDALPAPTVRDKSGKVIFRANSHDARLSRSMAQEIANSALIVELVNNLPEIIAALKAQEQSK